MQDAQTLDNAQGHLPDSAPDSAAESVRRDTREWSSDHPVNIRLSMPLGVGRYYLTIVGGKERRAPERLAEERKKHPLLTAGNVIVFAVVISLSTLAGFVVMRGMLWAVASFLQQQGSLIVN